jgi:hypothetical protein
VQRTQISEPWGATGPTSRNSGDKSDAFEGIIGLPRTHAAKKHHGPAMKIPKNTIGTFSDNQVVPETDFPKRHEAIGTLSTIGSDARHEILPPTRTDESQGDFRHRLVSGHIQEEQRKNHL